MKVSLVGYTGFVGSNLYASAGSELDAVYNSGNIEEAFGTCPDLLIYAGLRAEKYLANHAPEKDMELICQAEDNLTKINPKRLVLISTIDVFKVPEKVDETSKIDQEGLQPYGYNRYQLELWVRDYFSNSLIIRLPGLFGKNLKKNFIYDYLNLIPSMLTEAKFRELEEKDASLKQYYWAQNNGFYRVNAAAENYESLKVIFTSLGFSAMNFTDSRSIYQYYDLSWLWDDIHRALRAGIKLWHPATEPVSAGEIYKYLTGKDFINELDGKPAHYDYRSIYAEVFGGRNGYICSRETVLKGIKEFAETCKKK